MVTLSIPLVFLIPASEAVPGRAGEAGVGLRGQGQLPGEEGGLGDPTAGQGGRWAACGGWTSPCAWERHCCSLSDSPRQSSYDIYRVSSSQSVEDRGYVPQKESPLPETHTPRATSLAHGPAFCHQRVDAATVQGCLGN